MKPSSPMANADTSAIKRRYERLSRFYDRLEAPMEAFFFSKWRSRFRERIQGPTALEIGVGTGKNMPYYPPGVKITGIDFSPSIQDLTWPSDPLSTRMTALGLHFNATRRLQMA